LKLLNYFLGTVEDELEAGNLEEAMDAFPEAMKQALSEMVERIKKLQQEQQAQRRDDSRIIVPGR
jgi:hypothetical protein